MNMFKFCWRCQTSDIDTQLLKGVRCFDIRIRLKNDNWVFAHGRSTLKSTTQNGLDNLLSHLNKYAPNLIFFEFTRKFDWKVLVDTGVYIKEPEQFVGSMKSWYGKIWPWLYWKINNNKDKEAFEKLGEGDIALFDFV